MAIFHTTAPGHPNNRFMHADGWADCTLCPCQGHKREQLRGYRDHMCGVLFATAGHKDHKVAREAHLEHMLGSMHSTPLVSKV